MITATAKTDVSVITGPRASVGEAEAWKQALSERHEIPVEGPGRINQGGRVDMITVRDDGHQATLLLSDVKTVVSDKSSPPTPANHMPVLWGKQVREAIAPGRLNLGDAALEQRIRDAWDEGRVEFRQLNADYRTQTSTQGGGRITGW